MGDAAKCDLEQVLFGLQVADKQATAGQPTNNADKTTIMIDVVVPTRQLLYIRKKEHKTIEKHQRMKSKMWKLQYNPQTGRAAPEDSRPNTAEVSVQKSAV